MNPNMICPNCIYYNASDQTCRHHAPMAELAGQTPMTLWPTVKATDWCADGYSNTDGWYNLSATPAPR